MSTCASAPQADVLRLRGALCLILLDPLAAVALPDYLVAPSATSPNVLQVSLQLPAHDGRVLRLVSRGDAMHLTPQMSRPSCGSVPLDRNDRGEWLVPAACQTVRWTVSAFIARDGDLDASRQATTRAGRAGWLLLAEPTALLRIVDDEQPASIAVAPPTRALGAMPSADGGWRLPSLAHAPESLVLGDAPTRVREVGAFQVTYVADDPERVADLGLEAMHAQALDYLSRVVLPHADPAAGDRSLLVIWVGVDAAKGHVGGAAGSRSFVANYVFGAPDQAALNAAKTLTVTAHEQFHQLVDLIRAEQPPLSGWLGESLAEYYALKAVAHAAPADLAQQVRAFFVDEARPVPLGLREIERRVHAGDRTLYPRFYDQGATFWARVDGLLQRSPAGVGLDDLLPGLLTAPATSDGALPEAFLAALAERIGAPGQALVDTYVGP